MMTGTVNAHREAILRLTVRDANGQEHERDAVVDTGFVARELTSREREKTL